MSGLSFDTEVVTSVATVRRLAVWLDGAPGRIGTLIGQAAAGSGILFTYDSTYLANPSAVPLSASLPLRPALYDDAEARAFFDNLLPEGERRRSEALARRLDAADVTGLLEVLGVDCPGAVSVLAENAPPIKVPGRLDVASDYEPLDDTGLTALVVDTAAGRPMGGRARFSMAGVQRKLALARNPATGRFLLPLGGAPSTHILKVEARDGEHRGIVANEALCLDVLRRLGLPAVRAERMVIGGVPTLVVTRYDRAVRDGLVTRLHQEDVAQALGVPRELKYEDQAERAGLGPEQRGFTALLGRFAALTRKAGRRALVALAGGLHQLVAGQLRRPPQELCLAARQGQAGQLHRRASSWFWLPLGAALRRGMRGSLPGRRPVACYADRPCRAVGRSRARGLAASRGTTVFGTADRCERASTSAQVA